MEAPTPSHVQNSNIIYHQTIIPTQGISHLLKGSFTLPNATECIIIRHHRLELWQLHHGGGGADTSSSNNNASTSSGSSFMECIYACNLFAKVYAAAAVPTGHTTSAAAAAAVASSDMNHHTNNSSAAGVLLSDSAALRHDSVDYVALVTETGYVQLLRYQLQEPPVPTRINLDGMQDSSTAPNNADTNNAATITVTTSLKGKFVKVSEVCLGRSGARVAVPDARLVVDEEGTALFLTALLAQKVVIPLVRTHVDATTLLYGGGDHGTKANRRGGGASRYEEDDDDEDGEEARDVLRDDDDEDLNEEEDEEGRAIGAIGGFGVLNAKKKRIQREKRKNGVIEFGSPIEFMRNTINYAVCAMGGKYENSAFVTLEEERVEEQELQQTAAVEEEKHTTSNKDTAPKAFLKTNAAAAAAGASPKRHKVLVVYAYVASLRQVQRTHLMQVPDTAHRLVAVPPPPQGPGGVLVCTDTELIWYDLLSNMQASHAQQQQQLQQQAPNGSGGLKTGVFKCSTAFPRRSDFVHFHYDPSIIAHDMTCVTRDYFLLLQDEQGDLFRVVLTTADVRRAQTEFEALQQQRRRAARDGTAPTTAVSVSNPLHVHYFDTIPPVTTMAVFQRGFMLAAAESAPAHHLYKVTHDGYRSEAEYVIRRILQSKHVTGAAEVKKEEHDEEDEKKKQKRPREEGAGKMAMPAPMRKPGNTSSKAPDAMAPPAAAAAGGRVIAIYAPHSQLRHLHSTQSLTNTPAITSFTTVLPPSGDGGTTGVMEDDQQQQIQIRAVGGRGAESTLLHARYGYVTERGGGHTLATPFLYVLPLPSARELQQLRLERLLATAQATETVAGGATAARQRLARMRALRRLLQLTQRSGHVGVDRVLLCTQHGTSVYTLGRGRPVELDTLSGFTTAERTLAAATLHDGVGFLQVTQRALQVLPAPDEQGGRQLEPVTWTHPHGKPILAAACTPSGALVAFGQGGGIASFFFGLSGLQFQQLDALPTFPACPAVALLQPTAEGPRGAGEGDLQAILLAHSTNANRRAGAQLAAVATAAKEVLLLDPAKLREPLERIHCEVEVTAVLLTYLGGGGSSRKRLFLMIGHLDGTLTRCELDPMSAKLLESSEVACGNGPCQLVAGDGLHMCYVQAGGRAWRCALSDGEIKVMPWEFPTRQGSFARFVLPASVSLKSKKEDSDDATVVKAEEGSEAETFWSLAATTENTAELVIAIKDRELAFFSVQQKEGGGGRAAMEYSVSATSLPVAGRRILQHTTRPSFFFLLSAEHRGHSVSAVRQQQQEIQEAGAAAGAKKSRHPRRLDAPGRSLGEADAYTSTLQLYHEGSRRLFPPYYFPQGDAALCMAVGSFTADFGKEPVVIVGVANQYTHGAGCGRGASHGQEGTLRTFRCVTGAPQEDGSPSLQLEPVHRTILSSDNDTRSGAALPADFASAVHLCEAVGLLFVGMGAAHGLRIYSWGTQQLLRRRHLPNAPGRIIAIETLFCPPPPGSSANTSSSPYFARDLYRCPPHLPEAARQAQSCQLLVVCATVDQSVFVASLQPGNPGGDFPSYLLRIATDSVPRFLTSIAVLDERTIAAADRFGHVVFLRIPDTTRMGFAEPLEAMADGELDAAQRFLADQVLEEVACHHVGQVVTSLRVQPYDPTHGADPSLAVRILFYATTLGAVGAYSTFVSEEDGALAAYLRQLLPTYMTRLVAAERGKLAPVRGGGALTPSLTAAPVHHVLEGDLVALLHTASTEVFSTRAKAEIAEELARLQRVEEAQRKQLGLPPRRLPLVSEFLAKQRALVSLPL